MIEIVEKSNKEDSTMNVYGYDVPEIVITACMAAMKGVFTRSDICKAALIAGAPEFVSVGWGKEYCAYRIAYRIADRLLQTQRRQGAIRYERPYWHEV